MKITWPILATLYQNITEDRAKPKKIAIIEPKRPFLNKPFLKRRHYTFQKTSLCIKLFADVFWKLFAILFNWL